MLAAPMLIRSWLEPENVQPLFLSEASKWLYDISEGVVDLVVGAFANLAKSNVLMGLKVTSKKLKNTRDIIFAMCMNFQKL